jgi:5'-3' exonuclease
MVGATPPLAVFIDFMPLLYRNFYSASRQKRTNGENMTHRRSDADKVPSCCCSAQGVPVSALRGTMRALLNIMSHPATRRAEYVGAFMDTPVKSFRSQILPTYKAHRKTTPPALEPQVPPTLLLEG